MGRIRAPNNLPELVRSTFARAKANGEVNFYPTQAAVINVNSIPFQLRFSPSLANKPKPPKPAGDGGGVDSTTKPTDPFADPPAALIVSQLEPATHYLVLNKFAIVPEHFILATSAFAAQTDLLDAADLAAARACIDAYDDDDDGGGGGTGNGSGNGSGVQDKSEQHQHQLFVFFNSGNHSGASQAHRHLQLLPVARMKDGLPADSGGRWEVLATRLARDPGAAAEVPFRCFMERLHAKRYGAEADPEGAALREAYLALYRQACGAMGLDFSGCGAAGQTAGEAPISYNLAMTRDVMVLCPRQAEGGALVAPRPGVGEVGRLALNGTVLAGTALVKTEAEWDSLRADPGQLSKVLAGI